MVTTKFKISGMHCASCKALIESDVSDLSGVSKIIVDLAENSGLVEYDETKIKIEDINKKIKELGYKIEKENSCKNIPAKKSYKKIFVGVAIVALFVLIYLALYNLGYFQILEKLNEKNVSYGFLFIIGLITSFHCIGMCGGLVASYSVGHSKTSSHFQYNLGRFISYTLIGIILGGIGSFFFFSPKFSGLVIIIASVLMIVMGLSFLTEVKIMESIKSMFPNSVAKLLFKNKATQKIKAPFLIGILNGLMPCGPLQAMELYALSSGSALAGGLAMGAFALGTIPLMFGFGNLISYISKDKIAYIMKVSGLIIVILGIFMFNRGFSNLNISSSNKNPVIQDDQNNEEQIVRMDVAGSMFSPNTINIKKGKKVKWIITGKNVSGCVNEIVIYNGDDSIRKKIDEGDNIIEFMPIDASEIKFSCWMKMVWGKFIIN